MSCQALDWRPAKSGKRSLGYLLANGNWNKKRKMRFKGSKTSKFAFYGYAKSA